jgi:hypothetical protein
MTTDPPTAALAEAMADLLMDLRMDAPSPGGWTYQRTMRHYADVIVRRLLPTRLADDPFAIWQGACGHLWRRLPDPNECPTCAELARLRAIEEAARAFVAVWGETEAMESSHVFAALRAALGEDHA